MRPDGAAVLCHHAKTMEMEADWIAAQTARLHQEGIPYRDIAVLYRAHYLSRSVEEAFLKAQLPYTIYSGVQFFERREVKDALSYLRMAVFQDDLSFARIANVPKRNLGERRMQFLKTYAEAHVCSLYEALCRNLEDPVFQGTGAKQFVALMDEFARRSQESSPASELLAELMDESGYEALLRTEGSQERLDNLAELKQAVLAYEQSCGEECTAADFLVHAALFRNQDAGVQRDAVQFMTVHTAKGLEFPYVFFCGLNEGIFPSKKTRTPAAMEEERRLAFVALTRAMEGLYLSEAEGRNFDGSPRYPSRFLFDIGREHLQFDEAPAERFSAEAKQYIHAAELQLQLEAEVPAFAAGARVHHAIFGAGTVLETDVLRRIYRIQFDGMETPRELTFRVRLVPETLKKRGETAD